MRVTFLKKAYEAVQLLDKDGPSVAPDKFALKAFNCLIYG